MKENKEKGDLKSNLTKANTKNKKASKLKSNQIWEIWLKGLSSTTKHNYESNSNLSISIIYQS